jgi:carboxyl-terminal processing protease
MKQFLSLLLLSTFLLTNNGQAAYRDVPTSSKLTPTLERLIENGALEGQGFFRADSAMPQTMFWQIVVAETGFSPEFATFETPVPDGVDPDSDEAQYLREAIRRGWMSAEDSYDGLALMKRSDAIRIVVESKGIMPPQLVSSRFRDISSGVSRLAAYYPHIEAAYASGMLKDFQVDPFRPQEHLTRRELITWLQTWIDNGSQKVSTLTPAAQNNRNEEFPYQKRRTTTQPNTGSRQPGISISTTNQQTINLTNRSLDMQVWDAVISQIENKFKFDETLTDEKRAEMINAGIAGLVEALDDKYSNYVTPDKSEEFLEGLEGEFDGIGAYVEMIDENFTITSPIKGSPAEKAGLRAGDIVKAVDGELITGQGVREIIAKVRGPKDTKVTLTIFREFEGAKDYIVTRGHITIPALTLEFKNGVAIIGLHQFSRTSGTDLDRMIRNEVLPKNPRGIVFDLRNNPGGFLTSAVDVGEIFLKDGQEIFTVDYKEKETIYNAEGNGVLADFDGSMIFLQNKGSASASEILTAMVKDYELGQIMGTASTGKGTVQEIVSFTNGGNLKLTVAKWLSPDGNWINDVGVLPDVEIEDPTSEEKLKEEDRQLDAAIQAALR